MPYVVQARGTGSSLSQGRKVLGAPAYASVARDRTTVVEAVYSYRSSLPPVAIIADSESSLSLRHKLASRKRTVEDALETYGMVHELRGTNDYFLSRDVGHEFAKSTTKLNIGQGVLSMLAADASRWEFQGYAPPTRWAVTDSTSVTGGVPDPLNFFGSRGYSAPAGVEFHTEPILSSAWFDSASTQLIAAMNPVKTRADLLATIIELVSGNVPQLFRTLSGHFGELQRLRYLYSDFERFNRFVKAGKWMGGSSLNIQFGWAPIIRDIGNAVRLLLEIDQMIFTPDTRRKRRIPIFSYNQQVTKNEDWYGRSPIRPVSVPTGKEVLYNGKPPSDNLSSTGLSVRTDWTMITKCDLQVSARYSGNLVPSVSDNGMVDRASALLGLKLTPEVIWELTPWSWLLDWFANIGTVVTNASSLQMSGVLLNYAYGTAVLNARSSYVARPVTTGSGARFTGFTPGCLGSYESVAKVRRAASPFGFGISLGSLSATQWNILASLGLAKKR